MKKKIMRCIAALLCACTVFGTGVTCYAATGKTSGTITKSKVAGVFEYPETGHQLKVEIFYTSRDIASGIEIPKKGGNTANGNITSVSATANSGTGNEFTVLSVYGYVDGKLKGSSQDLKP